MLMDQEYIQGVAHNDYIRRLLVCFVVGYRKFRLNVKFFKLPI